MTWFFSTLLALASQNAGYSYPMTSSVQEPLLERENFTSSSNLYQPAVPREEFFRALDDLESRVDPQFSVPPPLRASVEFWLQVYTELSTQQVVLFDDRHPEIVYEVLDFRELAKTQPRSYPYLRRRAVANKMRAYERAFARLSATRGRERRTPEALRIYQATRVLGTNHRHHSFEEFGKNFRAQTGQRDAVVRGLVRADSYIPVMESIFSDFGLPADLALLSLLESSFETHATSRVGAKGVWQFMDYPGRRFLLINEARRLDERLSPLKSTVAAAQLLKQNKQVVGTWAGAITAYNSGPYSVTRRGRWTRNPDAVWRAFVPCSSTFGWAGRNYYSGFLAIIRAIRYRDLFFGQAPKATIKAVRFEPLPKRMTLLEVAWNKGITLQTLQALNPDVPRTSSQLPKGFRVALPDDKTLPSLDGDSASAFSKSEKL